MFADLRDFAPNPECILYSFGMTCQLLKVEDPGRVSAVMRTHDVKFSWIIDGVGYFDSAAFVAVCEQYKAVEAEIDRKVRQTVANN